ncbi:MAG TPA: hypothetical protein VIL20_05935, partial [Sandaracinaceae bacterium]
MNTTLFLRIASVLLVSCLAVACRSPRRQWTPAQAAAVATTGGGQTVTTGGVVARGTPREQLEQLDQVLRAQGFAPTGP